ncbi:MAG: 30S ribosomal protein S21 [bacterium]|nr:30S ribosomal protein S21 [bacterium]
MSPIVRLQPGESVDSLIRKFNKRVATEGILIELKKREYYMKPSLARKHEREMSRRKNIMRKRGF